MAEIDERVRAHLAPKVEEPAESAEADSVSDDLPLSLD